MKPHMRCCLLKHVLGCTGDIGGGTLANPAKHLTSVSRLDEAANIAGIGSWSASGLFSGRIASLSKPVRSESDIRRVNSSCTVGHRRSFDCQRWGYIAPREASNNTWHHSRGHELLHGVCARLCLCALANAHHWDETMSRAGGRAQKYILASLVADCA